MRAGDLTALDGKGQGGLGVGGVRLTAAQVARQTLDHVQTIDRQHIDGTARRPVARGARLLSGGNRLERSSVSKQAAARKDCGFFYVFSWRGVEARDMSVPAAFVGVILIWSTTPLAIQWSSEGGGFLFGVTARMVLGLLFCWLAIRLSGTAVPWHARARGAYVAAGAGIYGAMLLVYWGAQYIPSGWIAVLFGLSPLITSVFSALWLTERSLSLTNLSGLLLGVIGLSVIFFTGARSGAQASIGVAAVVGSTLLHAASAVWVRRLSVGLPAIAVTGGGLAVAVPAFILTWFVFDGSWPEALPERTRYAIVYLGLFGSVLGFFWYFYLLRRVEAVKVNLLTLVTPVTALLLGHFLNGEAVNARVWVGTALILLGLGLHQWPSMRRPAGVETLH